eukprot:CAMPEP_0115057740 /NCGR_PEP_ID=MMETSP0227-20121206/5938_1 /TAXON_ID=89957 /ORGANISM="Polarella glacialis, Strain CCMP 1383" /LENGTH=333 /DNA_ID=CAMNT_0002442601 /DNA_START=80 /DNA_END=1081 /DNA_ORIENTATION=+
MRGVLLTLLAAPAAVAEVCDSASFAKVACTPLVGGHSIPQIAMGTWSGSYGDCPSGAWGCTQQHARFAVENWLRIGGTHIDAANDYRTQSDISAALKTVPREEVFITTKCPGTIGYQALIQCADDNLQMLGQFTDKGPGYIDLLLIHFPFSIKPVCRFNKAAPECQGHGAYEPGTKADLQDTWRAMEDLKKWGVVKSIGVSDYNITQLQMTMETAKEPIEINQVEWNPSKHEDDMLAFCQKNKILLQAWSPLGGAGGSVMGNAVVVAAAKSHKVSTAQVVLRWSLQQGVAVVVGTANPEHAAGDLAIFKFTLTDDEMKSISALQGKAQDSLLV